MHFNFNMIDCKMGNRKEAIIQLKCTKPSFFKWHLISWNPHRCKGYTKSFKILSFSAGDPKAYYMLLVPLTDCFYSNFSQLEEENNF